MQKPKRSALIEMTLAMSVAALAPAAARQTSSNTSALTAQDRTEIQELVTHYARALATCAADDYADLFAAPAGYFASGPRGEVAGREKLVALVRSERHCVDGAQSRPFTGTGPTVAAEPSPGGAPGVAIGKTVSGNNGGHYEDGYVKTSKGWRFTSRNFISTQEEAAKLTAQDFIEIRQLAGNSSGHFDDVYVKAAEGRRFRSSGVVIAPSTDGATGKVFLKNDGGHYEDAYVKSAGVWRFKSRVHVAGE